MKTVPQLLKAGSRYKKFFKEKEPKDKDKDKGHDKHKEGEGEGKPPVQSESQHLQAAMIVD